MNSEVVILLMVGTMGITGIGAVSSGVVTFESDTVNASLSNNSTEVNVSTDNIDVGIQAEKDGLNGTLRHDTLRTAETDSGLCVAGIGDNSSSLQIDVDGDKAKFGYNDTGRYVDDESIRERFDRCVSENLTR